MSLLKVSAFVCLVALAAAAEEKDTKERKNRDVGSILSNKLDRGYLPSQKYSGSNYQGSNFNGFGGNAGGGVCDCRSGQPIGGNGYTGAYNNGGFNNGGFNNGGYNNGGYNNGGYQSTYSTSSYQGSLNPGYAPGYPGNTGYDDTVQVYPRPGPTGISGTGFGVSSSYGVPTGPAGGIYSGRGQTSYTGTTGIGGSGFIGGVNNAYSRPSAIGVSSSYTTGSSNFGLQGSEGYNYDKPYTTFH